MSSIPILAGRIPKKAAFCRPTKVQDLQWPKLNHLPPGDTPQIGDTAPNPPGFEVGFKPSSCRQSVEHCHVPAIHVPAEGFGPLAA